MSLDVSLYRKIEKQKCTCFCPNCLKEVEHISDNDRETLFDYNITHNLNIMAEAAGIYYALWRPEEIGITTASQLIPLLEAGLELLRSDQKRFEKYNASNGWGMYEHLVKFVREYLDACREYPDALVCASR